MGRFDNWEKGITVAAKKKIDELQAELDKYRWIPVEERLPEKNKKGCLLWHNQNDDCIQLRTYSEYIFDSTDSWGFTHWMPVP